MDRMNQKKKIKYNKNEKENNLKLYKISYKKSLKLSPFFSLGRDPSFPVKIIVAY